MPYPYQSSNYAAGDYYQAGGIFGTIGGLVGKGLKAASSFLPGPIGGVAGAIGGALAPPGPARRVPTPTFNGSQLPQVPTPGPVGAVQRFLPGGQTGMQAVCPTAGGGGYHANKALVKYARALVRGADVQDPRSRPRVVNACVRNRSMNPANPKALRRAIRRQGQFVALAKRTLRGTGYTIKRSGLPRTRRTRRK